VEGARREMLKHMKTTENDIRATIEDQDGVGKAPESA
jgi:hypothetical protein